MSDVQPKKRLGRGLSSLILNSGEGGQEQNTGNGQPMELPVNEIRPNPYQPRRSFADAELAELAESIRQQGIIQPIVVRRASQEEGETGFILISGERRLRAAKMAELATVPCVVKDANSRQMVEWALIENIHRTDLNPMEKAAAYEEYILRFDLTQAEAAKRLGQSRPTVANHLRLLDLPANVQQLVARGDVSFGHAKVLAGLAGDADRQTALADRVAAENISVRELEGLVEDRPTKRSMPAENEGSQARNAPAYVLDLEDQLTQAVGTKVSIKPGRARNTGKIVVDYYSLDDFERIARMLGANLDE